MTNSKMLDITISNIHIALLQTSGDKDVPNINFYISRRITTDHHDQQTAIKGT